MRRILITNDDGIEAPGLLLLAGAAKEFGEVWVVAPDGQRSGVSHSISLHDTVDLVPHAFPVQGVQAYTCSGTPADCVRTGSLYVLPDKPDLVLAGINEGYNVATDLQYSGTAGAAFEGAFQGILSAAISEQAASCHEIAKHYLPELLAELLTMHPAYGQIVNINIPGCPLSECRGILRDRAVSRGMFYRDSYRAVSALADGGVRLTVEGAYNEDAEPGTDFRAVVDRYISIGFATNIS
ncbi:MAG: 5'/3'-nucleotidase SurE [Oscillospiraceae bacterium]|nr:5'/3'-nucleotidase SurE [Oscillospiraceae bacterium]